METGMPEKYPTTDIIIPFYKNAALVGPLFESLERVVEELTTNYEVVAVNDSPEDKDLEAELSAAIEGLSRRVLCRLIRNERNLGFVRSVNHVLASARQSGHDALLL